MGRWGVKTFFEHGHVANQIDGDDEQNKMQVEVSPYGQTGDLGVRSKGQISLNFSYKVNYVAWVIIPSGGTWGCWGSITLSWGFAMAPIDCAF